MSIPTFQYIPSEIFLKIFIWFLKVAFHLQSLQNFCCIPHVAQYILVAYLTPNSLYLGSIREEFVNLYLCILKSCFLKTDSLFSYVLATHLG